MIYSLAPMEGITGYVFRRAHAACFGKLDRYYTPFITALRVGRPFARRYRKELDSQVNEGFSVIPQLLTRDADEFVWAAGLLADMGYAQVNLNLGCPSGVVVAKGKGAGMLRDVEALDAFLGDVCARSPIPVSVKTRLGIRADEEFERILEVYCRHPLAELIVHPRVQKDRYQGVPRQEWYGRALARAPFPVVYNGDVFAPADVAALAAAWPQTRHVMLGRGILANPALARELAGGPPVSPDELRRFHDELYRAYREDIGKDAIYRMKEWWFYARCCFADPDAVHRAVREVRSVEEYEAAVARVFAEAEPAVAARFR